MPATDKLIAFTERGPRLGDIFLLESTALGYRTRSRADLLELAGLGPDDPGADDDPLWNALESIARALNANDLTLAAIAWQQTASRSPLVSRLAHHPIGLAKAAVDDPKHPGYPAKTEGRKGGQFRPKSAAEIGAVEPATGRSVAFDPDDDPAMIDAERKARIGRIQTRRSFRGAMVRVLTLKQLLRLFGKNALAAATEEVPLLDIATTAAAVAEDMAYLRSVANEVKGAEAALKFVEHGPHDLSELLVSSDEQSFASYPEFKKTDDDLAKVFGRAGDDQEYHHIVEQQNAGAIPAALLQSTRNIVKIPRLLHEELNVFYSSRQSIGGQDLIPREYLRGKSFEQQYQFGLYAMRRLGILH